MIWKTKSFGARLFRTIIACFLIFCMTVESPLGDMGPVLAGEDEDSDVEYVSDVRLFYSNEDMDSAVATCKDNGYIPVRDDLNAGTERNYVILGYKTTKNREDAICSIRLLGMHDGFELRDYAELEDEYRNSQASKIDTIEAASDEFVTNYKKNSPMALQAYDALNLINVPEAGGQKLGDYIVEGNANWDFYARIITHSSSGTVNAILSELSYGLANYANEFDDVSGEKISMSWAEAVSGSAVWEELAEDLTEDDYDNLYKEYGDDAKDFHKMLQRFVTQYDNALEEYDQDEFIEDIKSEAQKYDSQEEIIEAVEENPDDAGLEDARSSVYVNIYDQLDKYWATPDYRLSDYLVDIGRETSEEVDLTKLYPILDVMSYAQRRMAGMGGLEALVTITGDNEIREEATEKVSEAREHLEELLGSDSMSVWLNTNEEIRDSKVAYTSEVIRMQAAQDIIDTYDPNSWKDTVDEVMQWVQVASGVFTIVTILIHIKIFAGLFALLPLAIGLLLFKIGLVSVGTWFLDIAATISTGTLASGPIGWVVTIVTIALTVIFWVAFEIYEYYKKNQDKKYTDVPDFVADRATGSKGDYIAFYKSVGSVDDPKHDGGDQHGEPGIPDVNGRMAFNGWNCMYASKDPNTGSPIVANQGDGPFHVAYGAGGGLTGYDSVRTFGENAPANCNAQMKEDDVNGIFIYYLTEKSMENPADTANVAASGSAANTSESQINLNGKQYFSDIKVASGPTEEVAKSKLRKQNMYIWDHNLCADVRKNYSRNKEWCYTYMGYKVTTNPKDAVTDIRVATFANAGNIGSLSFGDIKYGCAGTLGFPADSAADRHDEDFPTDLDGLWFTKNPNAGTPIEVSGLHIVNSHEDSTGESYVDKGWIPVTTFSGVPYNFGTTRDTDTDSKEAGRLGNAGYRYTCYQTNESNTWNSPRRYLYYEPQEKYTSGTKYLSGVFFVFGTDSEDTGAKAGEKEAKVSQLVDRIKEFPQAVVDSNSNLAEPFVYKGYVVESNQKYLYMGYTWSYSPYRALTNVRAFQGTIYHSELPYVISKPTDGVNVCYAATSVVIQRTLNDCEWVTRGISPENAYMAPNGLLGTNKQVPEGYTSYQPGGYDYSYTQMPWITTGLYVSGYYNKAQKLRLEDVVITGNKHSATNNNGVITADLSSETTLAGTAATGDFNSVQEMKAPYETEAFNLAYPAWTDDEGDSHTKVISYYMYIRKPAVKKKYISKIFVGGFSRDEAGQEQDADVEYEVAKQVDQQALVTANSAAADEVIPANLAVTPERTWYGVKWKKDGTNGVDSSGGEYPKITSWIDCDDNRLPWAPPDCDETVDLGATGLGSDYRGVDRPAAYLSVERTDKESEAVKGILLFKTNKDTVPEQIQVDGATYYCSSVSTPIRMMPGPGKDKQKYFVYYSNNDGVSPGQPVMELSGDDEVFRSGQATALCVDKQDKSATSAGGKKKVVEAARPYGDGDLVSYIHSTYAKTDRMYFNKIYVANGPKRKTALAKLLEQGCTEFLDMDLNEGTSLTEEEQEDDEDKQGGDYVFFGYRGYALDQKAINAAPTEEARKAEKQSQLEEAIYDVVCTVGEPFHPEGIVTDLNQLYYSPVSKTNADGETAGTDLNAGTNGPEIYMYFATAWGAEQYNSGTGSDTRNLQSTMPQDIFEAPITRFCFTQYDRVPYVGTNEASNGSGSDKDKAWEYVLCSDNKIPVNMNDGAVTLRNDRTVNNKIMMFAQRANGSVKPAAEITGGYTSGTTQMGEMWLNK